MSPSAMSDTHHTDHSLPVVVSGTKIVNGYDRAVVGVGGKGYKRTQFLFDRHLHKAFPVVVGGEGNWIYLKDGRRIFDSTSGVAVSCLGHKNQRVINAIYSQFQTGISYLASSFFSYGVVDELCEELIRGTGGKMARVYMSGSGSEAMEAALKLSRQFFYEKDKYTPRVNFIAREGSYHGNTIGALGVSGHVARRAPYKPFLMPNVHHVSACYAYRHRLAGESDGAFVARKAAELEAKFQELGPETVVAFIAEPVVGAAMGCVPSVPGYLGAMKEVCHRHGALFVLDEVMSGMGRCGTLHAWQEEGIVPDIQTVGKGLGAGYQPVAAVLVSERVVNNFLNGSGQFIHGQTYQSMPCQAAASLEVQRIIREDNLVQNVNTQGAYLGKQLKRFLGSHPHVGDIRGRGLFWGLEFVKNRDTKEPFSPALGVAQKLHDTAISSPYNFLVYPGTGCIDGYLGDHIILSPTFIVSKGDIDFLVKKVTAAVEQVFREIEQ